GLQVCQRRMEQPYRQVCAKGREEFALAGRAIVEHRRPGDYAPLAHGGNERADGGTDIRMEEHITADGASGIVLQERALRGSLVTVGERELFQQIPMPGQRLCE